MVLLQQRNAIPPLDRSMKDDSSECVTSCPGSASMTSLPKTADLSAIWPRQGTKGSGQRRTMATINVTGKRQPPDRLQQQLDHSRLSSTMDRTQDQIPIVP